ncbi:hypothetical protein KFU94_55795 [Chloroflexi bacterium TSY]|nr:hypothetical protein [Chloroflexi bacterium TSY]
MHVRKPIRFERLSGTRIVATRQALDNLEQAGWSEETIALRFAPDELYLTPPLTKAPQAETLANDPHAIILAEGAFSGAWVEEDALVLLERLAEWEMPTQRPAFVQGAVAGIATKLYFAGEAMDGKVLFLVQTPYAHELEARLA